MGVLGLGAFSLSSNYKNRLSLWKAKPCSDCNIDCHWVEGRAVLLGWVYNLICFHQVSCSVEGTKGRLFDEERRTQSYAGRQVPVQTAESGKLFFQSGEDNPIYMQAPRVGWHCFYTIMQAPRGRPPCLSRFWSLGDRRRRRWRRSQDFWKESPSCRVSAFCLLLAVYSSVRSASTFILQPSEFTIIQ